MAKAIIDTSVILAILKNERIDEEAYAAVDGGYMSAVNVAEIYTKLTSWNLPSFTEVDFILSTLASIEPFSLSQGRIAGRLIAHTAHKGLSLGDRCCLALALELGGEVYTTEERWTKVDTGCTVHLLRKPTS